MSVFAVSSPNMEARGLEPYSETPIKQQVCNKGGTYSGTLADVSDAIAATSLPENIKEAVLLLLKAAAG